MQSIISILNLKGINKIKEKENMDHEEPKFPLVEYLDATDQRKILPKTIGLINKRPLIQNKYPLEIIKPVFIGKDYAEPFSEGIKVIGKLKVLDLSSTDLNYNTLEPILDKAPISLESLNIMQNYNLTPRIYK